MAAAAAACDVREPTDGWLTEAERRWRGGVIGQKGGGGYDGDGRWEVGDGRGRIWGVLCLCINRVFDKLGKGNRSLVVEIVGGLD
jgi:hypothetical protein